MAGKRDKPEEIVLKLRQVEVLQGQGMTISEAAKAAGDPAQARNLLIIAELVQNGRAKEVLSQIFPASPS